MRTLGEVSTKESKKIALMGCHNSLKSFVGTQFEIVAAILDNEKRISKDGDEFTTNYIKIKPITETVDEPIWCKFTQSIISSQIDLIFENELYTDGELFSLEYNESASGNEYLSIIC